MEEERECLVRSHTALNANGSMACSRLQLSVLPLELLRKDFHCTVDKVLLVCMIVTGRRFLLEDAILDDREGTVEDAAFHVLDQLVVAHLTQFPRFRRRF